MGNSNHDAFQRRQEISFLERDAGVRHIKDISLLQKLLDYLNSLKQKNGLDYVIGEWYTHTGFGVSVEGHGVYALEDAKKLQIKYGRGDPFFGAWSYADIEHKLTRLTASGLSSYPISKLPVGQPA